MASASQPSASQPLPLSKALPCTFGAYELSLKDYLGHGNYGSVYACQRSTDGQRFAVKAIDLRRRPLGAQQQRLQTLLEREADILTDLAPHDHIVRCVDIVTEGNWLFFVFEMLQGSLLDALMGLKRPLRPVEACHVLRQLVKGLRFLHQQHIIHRDLKLENVLIARHRKEGRNVYFDVKIADFGLSKMLEGKLGQTHSNCGSRQYAAPEVQHVQAPARAYDLRADIWSLGVLFYVMLCADFPRTSLNELDDAIVRLPDEFGCRNMARCMLQRKPEDRISLERLHDALDRQSGDQVECVVLEAELTPHKRRREEQDEELARRLDQEEKDAQLALRVAEKERLRFRRIKR